MSLMNHVLTKDALEEMLSEVRAAEEERFRLFNAVMTDVRSLPEAFARAGVLPHDISKVYRPGFLVKLPSSGWLISHRGDHASMIDAEGNPFMLTVKEGKATKITASNWDALARLFLHEDTAVDNDIKPVKMLEKEERPGEVFLFMANASVSEQLARFVHHYSPQAHLSNSAPIKPEAASKAF